MSFFNTGAEVSHFKLVEKLGEGASGEVYRAEDLHLRRPVAIKFLSAPQNDEQKERFLREARIFSTISHPNIVTIYEIDWSGQLPFIVMELVDGEILSRRIRNQQVTKLQAVKYVIQLLEALEEVHQTGIVHRDVKSSNIMIAAKDRLKLVDFGLAKKIFSDSLKLTQPGAILGTVEFLSPEQAKGLAVDSRSDLFSAGVVFFHMLAGRLPFERETQVATYSAILNDRPPALSAYLTQTSEELESIMQKSLSKNPDERYQTAREFLDDVLALDLEVLTKRTPRPANAEPLSIAVLYFDRIGEQEESEYLRLGITEDIIIDLSKIAGLRILSRHAVQKYKDKQFELLEAIKDLQVHYILHGSVQKVDDRIRVSAQLVDSGGTPVWADRYDRELQDIFELQDHVAKNITSALQIRLTDSEQRSIQQRSTDDLQAYEFYLKGRHYYNSATGENNRKAEEMFQQAIAIDPNFAAAQAGLGEVYVQRFYNWFDRDRVWLQHAEKVIEKAYKLNDRLPEVHCTLGMLLYLRGDYQRAMEEMQKAIRLDPHYALAHDHTGEIYLHIGEIDKAIVAFHTELRINPDVIYPYFYLVWIHSLLGDVPLAQEVLEKARVKHSKNPLIHVLQGTHYSYIEELRPAEESLEKALSITPNNSFAAGRLAVVYAKMGRMRPALQLAIKATEEIDPMDHHAAFDRACVLASSGDADESFRWLSKAVDLGWRCRYHFENEKMLVPLRKDPRFARLIAFPEVLKT